MMSPVRIDVALVATIVLLFTSTGLRDQSARPSSGPDPAPSDTTPESSGAEDAEQPPTIEELERRVNLLADEIERLRSGEAQEVALSDEDLRALGLAPSAAATYRRSQGVSIAGYGEMLYENFASEDERGRPASGGAQLDFLRAIIYAGYRFNDKFLFNSEIEIKHANEISVEFAYVDYLPHFHAF